VSDRPPSLRAVRPTVDKHSTGGVGDGTTLVVGPLAAELGMQVVKLSGRGLGHTGGTLDKLESIPGMRVDLSSEDLLSQVERIGLAVAAQSADLVPADRALYAVRDVTATVDSVPLIASSIMSKKLAGGAQTILLDVKTGSGALGCARGALGLPRGGCRKRRGRPPAGAARPRQRVSTGAVRGARRSAGRRSPSDREPSMLPAAQVEHDVRGDRGGWLARVDTEAVGRTSGGLGAGRRNKEDQIDPTVGLQLVAKIGHQVTEGDLLARVFARSDKDADRAAQKLRGALEWSEGRQTEPALVHEVINSGGV
jgi:thymidine phosphorylase